MQRRILFENKNASDIYQNRKLTLQKEKRRQLTRQRLIWFCLIFSPPKAHSCLLPIQPWNNLLGVSSLTTAALFPKLLNILNKILEKNMCLFFNLLLMVLETPFLLPRNWKSNWKSNQTFSLPFRPPITSTSMLLQSDSIMGRSITTISKAVAESWDEKSNITF